MLKNMWRPYPCYYPGSRRGFRRTAADRMTTRIGVAVDLDGTVGLDLAYQFAADREGRNAGDRPTRSSTSPSRTMAAKLLKVPAAIIESALEMELQDGEVEPAEAS